MKIIGVAFGLKFEPFQKQRIWRFISALPHFFEVSCRGGGKTQDFLIAAFILCQGEYTQCAWLAGNNPQLEEAIKKSKPLLLLFGAREATTEKSHSPCIVFDNGSTIEFNPMTATSGGRHNLIVLDEGGKITEKDKKENYMFAVGMSMGTFTDLTTEAVTARLQGQVFKVPSGSRIRHCSTLAYDTPAEMYYKILEPLGLVFVTTMDQVWWVKEKYEKDPTIKAMADWFIQMEYYCKLMPRGQKIFDEDPIIIEDFDIDKMMAMYHDGRIFIGGDWNPAWGHAFVAVYYQSGNYVVFDELRTSPPSNAGQAIQFINKYKKRYGSRVFLKFETPTVINVNNEIVDAGIVVNEYEGWDSKRQVSKVTVYQGLVEHQRIKYTNNVVMILSQHERYAFDENGKIPRQEDHMLDCVSHVIDVQAEIQIEGIGTWEPI